MVARHRRALSAGLCALGLWSGPQRAKADALHCESQVKSGGHLAVEERGYELFIEPGPLGQSKVRLRVTYFNSSSQPMDMVGRFALPEHSQLQGLSVRGDHAWVWGEATSAKPKAEPTQGVYARLLDDAPPGLSVAEVVGVKMAPQSYTGVELTLMVPVQRLMKQERLCLPPRMIEGAGMVQQRRVSLRSDKHVSLPFWVDGAAQKGKSVALRANDRSCISWEAPLGAKTPLQVDVTSFFPEGESSRFALNVALGPQAPVKPKRLSVMLDGSSSVASSTFTKGAKLFYAFARQHVDKGTLWTFDRKAHKVASDKGLPVHPRKSGSDLVQALEDWLAQGGAKDPKETLLVITDGLLPLPDDAARLDRLERALKRRKGASIVILVDDPVLAQYGVGAEHPLLTLAAKTGAQLSLRSLDGLWSSSGVLDPAALDALFASPKVAQGTEVRLPAGCRLMQKAPEHLIAGQPQRLVGECPRKVQRMWARVRSRQGGRSQKARARSKKLQAAPQHWASARAAEQRTLAVKAGYPQPGWYRQSMRREAELSFAAAHKIRERRGHLDAELVQHRLREHLWPRAHACYNRALAKHRAQGGVAELAIALGKGEISTVRARSKSLAVKDRDFLECLEQAAWKIRVPAGLADPVVYRVYYPLRFSRPKNADVGEISAEDRLRYEWLMGRGPG